MKFEGKGLIFDPKKKNIAHNFNKEKVATVTDERLIELFKLAGCVCIDETSEESAESDYSAMTKKELILLAKESGITGSDRMSKEDIIAALEAV